MSIRPRAPRLRGALIAAGALLASLLPAHPASADWLTIRRGGERAIIDAALSAQATRPWGASFRADVAKGHPLAKLVVDVAWRAMPPKKGQPLRYESVVVLNGLRGGKAGIAISGAQAWARLPGQKPAKLNGELASARLPGLDAPLTLFATLAMAQFFERKFEGEFGGTAILRLTRKYDGISGLPTCKLGVSKSTRFAEMAEVGVGDGKTDRKLAWFGVREIRGQLVASGARLMRPDGSVIVSLERTRLRLGKAAKKLGFGKAALR